MGEVCDGCPAAQRVLFSSMPQTLQNLQAVQMAFFFADSPAPDGGYER
jgi:hypothetical protein